MAHRPRPGLLILLVLAMLVTGCAAEGGGNENGSGGNGGDSDGPILIGVNVEQSGGASVQGQAYVNALTLLAEQINDEGGILGRPVELEIVDNATDQTQAVTLTNQLVQDGVVAMIGPGTSPTTLAAMDVILESGIPTISMGSSDAISDPASDHPNVFKTPMRGSLLADDLATHFEEAGISRVGIIAVNNAYGDNGVESMQAVADEGRIELAGVERFEPDDTSMVAQLNNLLAAGSEAILCWAIPPGAPTVRRNAIENLAVDIPMYFDAGAGAELFIELAGDAADGAFIVHPKTLIWDDVPAEDPQAETLQAFGEDFTAEYGEMSGFAGYAWDALGLLRAAIEESGDTTPEGIIAGLENLGEYVGVTGTFEITAEDHQGLGEGDMVVLKVEDGDWIPVSTG